MMVMNNADDETVEKAGETGHTDNPKLVAYAQMSRKLYTHVCALERADLWSEREPRTCSGKKLLANHNAKVC